jgi:parvulin-like peptidyl-prolyl isomerase
MKWSARIFCFWGLLISIVTLSACSSNHNGSEDQVVLMINDQKVYLNEVMVFFDRVEEEFESIGGLDIWETDFDGRTAEELAKERTIENVLQMKIIADKAKELGINLTEEEKLQIKDQVQIELSYSESENRLTEQAMTQLLTENVLSLKVYNELTKDFQVDEDQVEENLLNDVDYMFYHQADLNDLLMQVRAKHILFKTHDYNESMELVPLTESEQEEALIKAEEVHKRALEGEDFVSLVQAYSEDQESLASDGEYIFPRGYMVPEFEYVAFNLEPGEIGELIKTDYGYHIIKVEEIILPTEEDKEQFQEQFLLFEESLKEQYIERQKVEAFNKQYEEWKQNYNITIVNEVWDKVRVKNKNE